MERITRLEITCAECGVVFKRLKCQIGRGRGRFCSKKCGDEARRHGSTLYCAWCDTPFYRRFGEQDLGVAVEQFCSRECYAERRASTRTSYPKGEGGRHKHRIVAEAVLGRPLAPKEVVHHFDEDRQNYHPSNLAVFPTQAMHARAHSKGLKKNDLRRFSLKETAHRERLRHS